MPASTQNHFGGELNSSGSSKGISNNPIKILNLLGSSASSSFGQNSSKKESSTKKLIIEPYDDPELNMLLKQKMKKVVKQHKDLFTLKRKSDEKGTNGEAVYYN